MSTETKTEEININLDQIVINEDSRFVEKTLIAMVQIAGEKLYNAIALTSKKAKNFINYEKKSLLTKNEPEGIWMGKIYDKTVDLYVDKNDNNQLVINKNPYEKQFGPGSAETLIQEAKERVEKQNRSKSNYGSLKYAKVLDFNL